jgi:hypothetical protein
MAPSPGSGISSTYKSDILWLWILLGFKTTLLSDCPSPIGCYSPSWLNGFLPFHLRMGTDWLSKAFCSMYIF